MYVCMYMCVCVSTKITIPKLNMCELKRCGKASRNRQNFKGKVHVELHQRAVDTSNLSKSQPRVHFLSRQEQGSNHR